MPDPVLSAQRNLRGRIDRFKATTEWQERKIEDAKECLETGRYRLGEDFMMQAERPDLYDIQPRTEASKQA